MPLTISRHSKLQKLHVNTMFWCSTLAYASSDEHLSTNERMYRLKWHCGKAKRQWESRSFVARIFVGGNWWIQCC